MYDLLDNCETNDYFVENLETLLKENNLTKKEFAKEIDMSYVTVVAWLNGRNYPNNDISDKIASYFKISTYELFAKDMEVNDIVRTANKNILRSVFSFNLTQILEQKDIAKNNIAFRINVSSSTFWKWTTGRSLPNSEELDNLCEDLEIDRTDLFILPDHIKREINKNKFQNNNINQEIFTENFQYYLKHSGYTIASLSRETGIIVSTIENWNKKKALPRYNALTTLANAFGVSEMDLINTPRQSLQHWLMKELDGFPESKNQYLLEFVNNIVKDLCALNNK